VNTGEWICSGPADSLMLRRNLMKKQDYQVNSLQLEMPDNIVYIITSDVFNALHPIEQMMVRSLERIGKIWIVSDSDVV